MLHLPTRVITQDSESTVFAMGALVVYVVALVPIVSRRTI